MLKDILSSILNRSIPELYSGEFLANLDDYIIEDDTFDSINLDISAFVSFITERQTIKKIMGMIFHGVLTKSFKIKDFAIY